MSTASEGLPNFLEYYLWYQKFGFERAAPFGNPAQWELFKTQFSPITQLLKKYGSDAHLYLPGTQYVQGFTPGNYIDSAGTQPAVLDQPVGLVLDAAGSVGADLFSVFGVPVSGVTVDNGTRTATFSGAESTWSGVSLSVAPEVNKTYRVKLSVVLVSGEANLFGGGNAAISGDITSSGTYTYHTKASTTGAFGIQSGGVVFNGTVRVDSIQEVTGIHANQATPGYKPIERRGIVNLLTYSNDLSNAAWGIKSAGGTATANSVSFTTNPYGRVLHSYTHTAGAITVAASFNPSDAGKAVHLGVWDSVLDGLTTGGSASLTIPASGLVVFNITSSGGSGHTGVIGTGVATTLSNPSVGLFAGTLTAQQILAAGGIPLTTTAPASSSAGVNYLEFNAASTQRLDLASTVFQMGDDHCVVATLSIASTPSGVFDVFTQRGATGTPIVCELNINSSRLPVATWRDNTGTLLQLTGPSALAVGQIYVLAARKVGNTQTLWVNGVIVASSNTVFGAATITYARIGGDVLYGSGSMDGALYSVNPVKGTLTDADVLTESKFAAQCTGIQL